jgi:hypothetical protein
MPVLGKKSEEYQEAIARAMAARDAALNGRDGYAAALPSRGAVTPRERTCGAPDCRGGWIAPWKNRRRPIFEQEWGCGERCLTTLVQAAVQRETGDGVREAEPQPHRHRVPLGLVLLAQGWITHPQLQTALQAQRETGRGRIGDWLTQSCGLDQEHIARGLGVQWNCPVLSLEGFSPAKMALVMPKRLIAEYGLVPVRLAGSSLLYVAFQERMDAGTALGMEQMCGLRVESGLLPGTQFETARAKILAAEAAPAQIKLVADRDAMTAGIVRALEQRQPLATRLVRIHQYYWLRMWLETGAMEGVANIPPEAGDVADYLFLLGTDGGTK